MGRPNVYEESEDANVNFHIPVHFKEIYKRFKEIMKKNKSNAKFLAYCKHQEGLTEDKINNKDINGLRSCYFRWVIADHVIDYESKEHN